MIRMTVLVATAAVMLAACSSLPRNPVPLELQDSAEIPGMPHVRFWADAPPSDLDVLIAQLGEQRRAAGIGDET